MYAVADSGMTFGPKTHGLKEVERYKRHEELCWECHNKWDLYIWAEKQLKRTISNRFNRPRYILLTYFIVLIQASPHTD